MNNEAVVAVITAVLGGGAGLKLLEKLFGGFFAARESAANDVKSEATAIRGELREEVKTLRQDMNRREQEHKQELREMFEQIDHWRNAYYDMLGKYHKATSDILNLQSEVNDMKRDLEHLKGN
jgi:uncharacterized coiled-coil DUF342 family protein